MAQSCPEIIGYIPNWQWYDRAHLVNPMTIQYAKYSILNYAFFKPELNGSISSTDTWADENLLLGQINWSTSPVSYYPNTSIVSRAHLAGTKVLPSIGGWTLSDYFPSIAASVTKRNLFAHSCCDLIRTYGFDGIDIDWEYPGYTPHNGTPSDKQNYTLFLQQIRDSITQLGIVNGKTYLLTTCVGASHDNMLHIEWNAIQNIVDIINLMSYDFFGSWDAVANHNAPLHNPVQGDATFNVDSAVSYLLNHYQVPASKLAAGVAFYGRSAKTSTVPALFAPITGADNITFSDDDGTPLYYNILKKQNLFTSYWDSVAQVPYLLGNGSLHTFVSYDNATSIALKASYIKNHGLKGAIIWEITGDYIESSPGSGIVGSTPLIDTLRSVFCTTTPILNISVTGSGSVCPGGSMTLTATSGFSNYIWNTGDTTQSIVVSNAGTYSVSAAWGSSTYSDTQVVSVLPCNFPGTMQHNAITNTSAQVHWSPVPCAIQYVIRYRILGAANWTLLVPITDTMVVLNGLQNSTGYEVQVQSICNTTAAVYSVFSTSHLFYTLNSTANQAPVVSIVSPLNNAIFTNGSGIPVSVTATDPDGNIQGVKLLVDNVLYGTDLTAPFSFILNGLATGNHTLVARATDNMNDSSNSTPVTIVITNASPCSYPVWNASSIYNANDTVVYNAIIYRARWWTQNNIPSSNYGNCCVWQYIMPCGGFPASTCYLPLYDSLIAYNANERVYWNGVVYKAKWWTLNQHPVLNSGPADVWMIDTTVQCNYTLNVKFFLEGFYTGSGLMSNVLYHQGIEGDPLSLHTDSVQIELHSSTSPFGLLYTKQTLVNRNGMAQVPFPPAVSGNSYYIVLKHRSGVETWSAGPVVMNQVTYDFTTQASKAFGANQVAVDPGVYALYSGDLNQDENIDLLDIVQLDAELNNFSSGYFAEDVNGDGNVDLLDLPVPEANAMNFIYSHHP